MTTEQAITLATTVIGAIIGPLLVNYFDHIIQKKRQKRIPPVSAKPKQRPLGLILGSGIVVGAVIGLVVGLAIPRIFTECRLNNLINCSVPVPISSNGSSHVTAINTSGNLEIVFSNGQGFSGVALQFTPALGVQEFTHLDISGTATQDFTLQIEYKVREGTTAKVVKSSAYQSFPAASVVSTIPIPLTFAGKVDEIALMFYIPDEASHVTIQSIRLK